MLIALLDRVTGPILPRRPAAIIIMIFLVLYALLIGPATAAVAAILRTDLMGTLEVQSDGRQMWWKAEHVDRDSLLP